MAGLLREAHGGYKVAWQGGGRVTRTLPNGVGRLCFPSPPWPLRLKDMPGLAAPRIPPLLSSFLGAYLSPAYTCSSKKKESNKLCIWDTPGQFRHGWIQSPIKVFRALLHLISSLLPCPCWSESTADLFSTWQERRPMAAPKRTFLFSTQLLPP